MHDKPIILEDNHESRELSDDEANKLLRFAGYGLKELCADNPALLLFPDCFGDNGDGIDEPLYSIVGKKLCTGNIVGFWGVNGVNVRVHSRFDDEKRQYFFHYMLQRISGVNVLDMKTLPDSDDIWDFLVYLFPMALKSAVRKGIFRAYRVFRYDDDRVKGTIDVSRFIRRDIPFLGRVSYVTREHTANNYVIQLVRHAIEYVRRKAPALLTVDLEMRQAVDTIVQATPDYSDKARNRVVAANLRPIRHPFYSAYTGLQKLCLQMLRHEKLSYGENDGNICGIVFDAAWLWEEYLNTIFSTDSNWGRIVHPRNRVETDPVYFYKPDAEHRSYRSKHYPDFYDVKRQLVLDAKYKFGSSVASNDLLQMISYIHVLGFGAGVFLKPDKEKTHYAVDGTLNTPGGEIIGVATLRIPQMGENQAFADFVKEISCQEENQFKEELASKSWQR